MVKTKIIKVVLSKDFLADIIKKQYLSLLITEMAQKSKLFEIHEIKRYEIPTYEPNNLKRNYVFSSDDLPKKAKRCKLCNK